MNEADQYLLQLGRTIQSWLGVEAELYYIYTMFMRGASSHFISATFHSMQSVNTKLNLLNSCFEFMFDKQSDELNKWKKLSGDVRNLNAKRNKIVHEPVSRQYMRGMPILDSQEPSHTSSLTLVKKQTSSKGKAAISPEYRPADVAILKEYILTFNELISLGKKFNKATSHLYDFRILVTPVVNEVLDSVKKKQKKSVH